MIINKKLRDVTPEEFKQWKNEICKKGNICCNDCVFKGMECDGIIDSSLWVNNKKLYSSIALDQEIEIVEKNGSLTKDEKEYLSAVIKPFRDRIIYIKKTIVFDGYGVDYAECISIILKYKDEEDITELPIFEEYSLYKGMEVEKEYTLEELGL